MGFKQPVWEGSKVNWKVCTDKKAKRNRALQFCTYSLTSSLVSAPWHTVQGQTGCPAHSWCGGLCARAIECLYTALSYAVPSLPPLPLSKPHTKNRRLPSPPVQPADTKERHKLQESVQACCNYEVFFLLHVTDDLASLCQTFITVYLQYN